MAKALSKGDGAVSVAALFNSCVDDFKCIRLSRQFGEDFERCQIQLDVAKSRFARWGEAVGVNSKPRFTLAAQQADDVVGDVLEILGGIEPHFKSAQKKSLRYAKNNTDANLVKKSRWVLHDKKSLDSIISQILSRIDKLESLFPDEMTAIQKFIEIDTEPVNGKLSLETLQKAARGIDPALEKALKSKAALLAGNDSAKNNNNTTKKKHATQSKTTPRKGNNSVNKSRVEDAAKLTVGDVFPKEFTGHHKNKTRNTVHEVLMKG